MLPAAPVMRICMRGQRSRGTSFGRPRIWMAPKCRRSSAGPEGRVREPELQASIARTQLACATEICGGAPLHGEASGRKIIEERLLDALSQLRRGEVIDLGKD